MADNPLFRKAALDKAASPERLDVLMQVTSPKGWLALWTMGGVLVGVILWGIWGSIPTQVAGQGLLIRGNLREINASGDGNLISLTVAVNDIVTIGQVIAEITQVEGGGEQEDAYQRYQEATREVALARAEADATIAGHRQTITDNEGEIVTVQAQLVTVEADLERLRDLLSKGLVTDARVRQPESTRLQLTTRVNSLNASINSVQAAIRAEEAKVRQRNAAAQEARRRWASLSEAVENRSSVTSTVAGRVTEVDKSIGDLVRNGERLVIVEPEGDLAPVVYISATQGIRVKAGMEARVYSSEVPQEEYGYLIGEVETVGEIPITPEGMNQVVRNDTLVQQLLGNSPKIEVRVGLSPKAENPSGFDWSTSQGPPYRIQSGQQVTVDVVIERVSPIIWVMPFLRGYFGFS